MISKIFKTSSLIMFMLVLFSTAGNVFSYTIEVDDDNKGAFFTVSAVSADNDQRYSLWDDDSNSSSWILDINGVFVAPMENGWIRDYHKSGEVYKLQYSNRSYSFENEAVVSSSGSYLLFTAIFTNNSSEQLKFAPRLLLDTSLGEETGLPFVLPDGSFITTERYYEGSKIPEWIGSIRSSGVPALYIFMEKGIGDRPQSVIMSNWLRLKQSTEDFIVEEGRRFDNLPFSEADSALMLKFSGKKLQPGETMTVRIILGLNPNQPGPEAFISPVSDSVDFEKEQFRLREYTLKERLTEVDTALDKINNLLEDESLISDEAVLDIELSTANQEKLRAEYENL